MPNWNSNVVTISHEDPEQIARVVKAYQDGRLFSEFVPVPPALLNPLSSTWGGPDREKNDELRAQLKEEYGYENWYDWCVDNWGTKWDVNPEDTDPVLAHNGLEVTLYFETAWSPPIEWYDRMSEDDFGIDAYYYEPGMAFCGHWSSDTGEESYDITGNSEWVRDNIPEIIDEMFNISENMEMWEEESE